MTLLTCQSETRQSRLLVQLSNYTFVERQIKWLKAAFTRQTKVGKLVLANSSWCM